METDSRASKSERGIALMMTLGMLALILILAMSFSFQAQTDKMLAATNADYVRARLLCESGFERVVAYFNNSFSTIPFPGNSSTFTDSTSNPGVCFWFSPNAGSQDTDGLSTGLSTNVFSSPFITALRSEVSTESWQHITADLDGDGDGELTGRVAFLVLDESGKLGINSALQFDHEPFYDKDGNGACNSGEFYFDLNQDGSWGTRGGGNLPTEGSEVARGWSLGEIGLSSGLTTKASICPKDLDSDGEDDRFPWSSLTHIKKANAMSNFSYGTETPYDYDIEAYYDSVSDKYYHRFDLTGYSWDPGPTDGETAWDALHDDLSDVDYVTWLQKGGQLFWSSTHPTRPSNVDPPTASTSDGGINWLQQIQAETDANGDGLGPDNGDHEYVRKAVTANLIDYCDSDSAATVATTDADGDPVVMGLEKVPYVNEVSVVFGYERILTTHIFGITAYVELANIYADPLTCDVEVEVQFEFEDRQFFTPSFVPESYTLSGSVSGISVPGKSYYCKAGTAAFNPLEFSHLFTDTALDSSGNNNRGRVKPRVTSIRITVNTTDGLGDFAKCTTVSGVSAPGMSISGSGVMEQLYAFNTLETEDPRKNSASGDWVWKSGDFDTTSANNSLDDKNSNSDASSVTGEESDADVVAGMSTAYIADKPMLSLWELGAIYRGEKWRTINLRKYNDMTPDYNLPRTYSNGDARLLDEVKLGAFTIADGKFNANSQNQTVWQTVLGLITTGGSYDNSTAGSSASTKAGDIVAVSGSWGHSRAEGAADFAAIGSPSNDAEREELVGKLAQLLTVRSNFFTVISVAQSVQDIGDTLLADPPDDCIQVTNQSTGDATLIRVLAEQKMLAVLYRNAQTGSIEVKRVEFLED